ncbi:hypothetical protein AB1Y20_013017 [Prymnesium parvum]|uniref:Uncharacterized protein n=1 Tax=Prymnesium parvum TaxID=97485 RepID=A0AB34ILJ1_PRYPA
MTADCAFEDSDGACHPPPPRGVCAPPASGRAAAFVQHERPSRLCARPPPFGFQPLCAEPSALRMLSRLRDPAACRYRSCAVVGAAGTLLGARLGAQIDAHDAVLRINLSPDGVMAARAKGSPHSHERTWVADVGARTTWRVLTMEVYGYMRHYPRLWLGRPSGWGRHRNMSGIPQQPLLAVSCHQPGRSMGRCRLDRLQQVFDHPWSASYLINPVLLHQTTERYFKGVKNQLTLSTGMTAIALAREMCAETHVYGFGNGSCGDQCYHYYECAPKAPSPTQSKFFGSAKSSAGYHNFSAQANALLKMARAGEIIPHWGSCSRSFGDPPDGFANTGLRKAAGGGSTRRLRGRGKSGGRKTASRRRLA